MVRAFFFKHPLEKIKLHENALIIDLILAKIKLDIIFDSHRLSKCTAPESGSISSHSSIVIWEDDLIRAELLKTKYVPQLPLPMYVSYCWAYLWRVKLKRSISSIIFECSLEPKHPLIEEGIETGENVFSKSFLLANEYIYLGTEDQDKLLERANRNDGVPKRYIEEQQIDDDLIESSHLGIKIHLPLLKEEELVQVHFVVAGGEDPIANWFAVDVCAEDIVHQAGI